MSRTSKKCNELCNKIQSISGLDDNYVYGKLLQLEYAVNNIINDINSYADENPLNGVGENVRRWLDEQ